MKNNKSQVKKHYRSNVCKIRNYNKIIYEQENEKKNGLRNLGIQKKTCIRFFYPFKQQ